jgi:hypothetical protein
LYRVQVKTAEKISSTAKGEVAQYYLPLDQLSGVKNTELYYIFVRRLQNAWDFVVLSRIDLLALRKRFEASSKKKPPRTKVLNMKITFTDKNVTGWGESLQKHRRAFLAYFPKLAR